MTITITIDPSVESIAIQTIALALGVTGTDAACRQFLADDLKKRTAQLYVQGDKMKRDAAANASAETAAATKIVTTVA